MTQVEASGRSLSARALEPWRVRIHGEEVVRSLLRTIQLQVAGSLQLLENLLELHGGSRSDGAFEVVASARQSIEAVRLAYELLAKAPDGSGIDLGNYGRALARCFCRSHGLPGGRISVELEDPVRLDADAAPTTGLLLGELFAFVMLEATPGQEVRLRLEASRQRGSLQLVFRATGAPPPSLGSPPLRLQIAHLLLRQAGATAEVRWSGRPGDRIQLPFPDPSQRSGVT